MININDLEPLDVGRSVIYHSFEKEESGRIKSWNTKFIFVEFPPRTYGRGEACDPNDLDFMFASKHAKRKLIGASSKKTK